MVKWVIRWMIGISSWKQWEILATYRERAPVLSDGVALMQW